MHDGGGPIIACMPLGEHLGKDPLSLIGSLGSVDSVENGFLSWPLSRGGGQEQSFTFRDIPFQDCADIATALVVAGSFPQCTVLSSLVATEGSDRARALLQLCQRSYVEELQPGHWRLTEIGLKQLISVSRLGVASRVCQPRADIALEDATSHELISWMRASGWSWARWTGSRRQPSGYSRGQQKQWFTSGVTVCKAYLMALLRADELFEGGLEMIPHASAEKVLAP